jgi:hypothetical protein
MTRSLFDLGPRGRVAFAAVWLAAQALLIATAELRPEHAFAFRMFSEGTTAELQLSRVTFDGTIEPAARGAWWTRDRRGVRRRLAVRDYIDAPELSTFEVPTPAAYGRAAELSRLGYALDDVVARLGDDDATTAQLVVDITLRRSGAPPEQRRVVSRQRSR